MPYEESVEPSELQSVGSLKEYILTVDNQILQRMANKAKLTKKERKELFGYVESQLKSDLNSQDVDSIMASHEFGTAIDKCVNCHMTKPNLAADLKTWDLLTNHLAHEGIADQKLKEMIGNARLSPEEESAVHSYVKQTRTQSKINTISSKNGRYIPDCYESYEDRKLRTEMVPKTDSKASKMAGILEWARANEQMVFYDKNVVPRTWQSEAISGVDRAVLRTAKNAVNQDMYDRMGYFSDAGREHPWNTPAGLDISPNASRETFFIPPSNGPLMQVFEVTRNTHPNHFGKATNVNGPQMGWSYGDETVFGEVLKVNGIPYKMRTREKQPDGSWQTEVFSPFDSSQELAQAVEDLCKSSDAPAGCAEIERSGVISELWDPATQEVDRRQYINSSTMGTKRDPLMLNRSAWESTLEYAEIQLIPEMPDDVVAELYARNPFKPTTWSPSTHSEHSIVPKDNFEALIPVNQESCMHCHADAGIHVDNVEPHPQQMYAPSPTDAPRPRTWYNFVPGFDSILGFNPWSGEAVARGAPANRSSLNRCLLESGLVTY